MTIMPNYFALVIGLRLLLAIYPPSYIHPDEFFQSQEVLAGIVYGTKVYIPWEFQAKANGPPPSRTIVTPGITSGSSFSLLSFFSTLFNAPGLINGRTMLYAPRLCMIILTLSVDLIILSICTNTDSTTSKPKHDSSSIAKYLLATSWVATSYFPRPFSNTCELISLACSFGILLNYEPGNQRSMALGCILAIGTFTRFTFVVFFLPLGIALLFQHDALYIRQFHRKLKDEDYSSTISRNTNKTNRFKGIGDVIVYGFIGAFSTSALFVTIDSMYFGRFTIAPLNNALYNMDSSNLAEHGLHPRWLHVVVNMHVLFGPLAILTYIIMIIRISTCLTGCNKRDRIRNSINSNKRRRITSLIDSTTGTINVNLLCMLCIASGLGFLSLAPHQEARFLLPLLVPIIIVCSSFLKQIETNVANTVSKTNAPMKPCYYSFLFVTFIFNFILLLLFGIFHQGGLIRSILHLEHLKNYNRNDHGNAFSYRAYFYKTHMPPRFMLSNYGSPGDAGFCEVIDLKGAGIDILKQKMIKGSSSIIYENKIKTLVIAPKSVHLELDKALSNCLTLQTSFWPHLSMEDLPSSISDLELQVFEQSDICRF
jgi:phosphatidylinositol glycan class Z